MDRREVPAGAQESGVRTGHHGGRPARILLAVVLMLFLFSVPGAAGVTLFSPSSSSIASQGVLDMAEGRDGAIYFATDTGLSVYRDGWMTLRTTTPLANGSILSNHVLAVETDHRGFIWVGYPNGLQVLAGDEIITFQDQQMLKNLNINALKRVDEDMWVATGSAGIHRWRNGTWYWFIPWGGEGLGAYDIRSIDEDRRTGDLYMASGDNGVWVTRAGPDPLWFSRILAPAVGDPVSTEVRADLFGGMYLFNRSMVFHHSRSRGFQPVLNASDLGEGDLSFFDLAVADNGAVWIASDHGIYGLPSGEVTVHLTMQDGIGTNAVKRIFTDHWGRVWFVTTDAVGYFTGTPENQVPLTVRILESGAGGTPAPDRTGSPAYTTPVIDVKVVPGPAGSSPDPVTGFLSGLVRWLANLFGQQ
jgi:ligand-binding sensor domain-containing protein